MKYKVKKKLRQMPGNVTVYEADQKDLQRKVEVRVFDKFVDRNSDTYLRFEREFKTIARLDHPNVVKVYDWGLADDKIYYVAERRPASPLDEFLTKGPRIEVVDSLEIGVQIADALAYLHDQQLVHRDVGPLSVYYAPDKKIAYIAHFTMVKNLNLEDLTAKGVAHVAPLAFTPERLQQLEIDTRTDVFLLGALLYQLLTGQEPLSREKVLVNPGGDHPIAPPSERAPELDERIDPILLRALAWDPQERYQEASAFKEELETLRDKIQARGSRPRAASREAIAPPPVAETGQELASSEVPASAPAKAASTGSSAAPTRPAAAVSSGPGERQLRAMGLGAMVDQLGAPGTWGALTSGLLVLLLLLWLLL